MVEFHSINKVMTAGTILFTISLIIMAIGVLFHSDKTLLTYTFIYALCLFDISVITIFAGALMGARGGNLQIRFNETQNNAKKKK